MELEINQYLAQQREMAGEQMEMRRDRGRDYNWDRNQGRERRRNRSRPSRFNDADEDSALPMPQQLMQMREYDGGADTKDYREQEIFRASRRDEQHGGESFNDRRSDDRFGDRYEDSKRYPRGEDRLRGQYDDRREGRLGDRRSDRHEDRYGGRRGDRPGDRADRGDRGDRYGESRDRGSAKKEKPSRTVMLKSLHSSVTDHDIRAVLQMFGAPVKDVRLVRHRDTGASRGFAFVEFQFLPDAQRWMEENQNHIILAGQDTQLVYSSNKDREEDWFCSQCGTHNFKRREYCFKCSISKDDSERYSEIGDVASNVLILMGLDALTTEETVTKVLEYISSAKMVISIARDNLTHTSRGYCYVEMSTPETATHLMNILASMQPPFQIDGKPVSVHFRKQHVPDVSKVNEPAAVEPKWSAYGTQGAESTTQPSSNVAAGTAYYQEGRADPAKLMESQGYVYQSHLVPTADTGLPGQAGYPAAPGVVIGSSPAASTTLQRSAVIPANKDQYKTAVAQEQVQAARQLQLQQLQQQLIITTKLQDEARKKVAELAAQTAEPAPARAAAAASVAGTAASTAALAAGEESEEALNEKARQWTDKKKRRKEDEAETEKTAGEMDEGGAAMATSKKKKRKKQESSGETAAPAVPVVFVEGIKYPNPDVSKYHYDEASGFYYDATVGLYYDANSQYYFNSVTQKYLYWDATTSTYLPAPEAKPEAEPTMTTAKTDQPTSDKSEKAKEKDKKDKNDKNKMAKKLAKDMARWAKSMNSSKANAAKKGAGGAEGAGFMVGAADAGFAMLMKKASPADTKATLQHVLQKQTSDPGTGSSKLGIVASYGGGSDSEPEPDVHPAPAAGANPAAASASQSTTLDALTDWSKLICLLCKRQFPSREILVKHQQFSELHKQNLANLKHESQDQEGADADYQYRDRAKERRQKFGVDDTLPKKKFRPPKPTVPYEEPTKAGLKDDNIGNQMLQKMGWNKGTGLGKKQQGRMDPIQVQKRQAGAGLGVKGGNYDITATDTYRDAVKKVMRNRFEEME